MQQYSKEELTFAVSSFLHTSGKRDAAKIVKEVATNLPKRVTELKKASTTLPKAITYTEEEALALFIDGRFTRHSYILMQRSAKERNANIYPPYNNIIKAKNGCFPDNIVITETSAEVTLENLLDHTTRRLLKAIEREGVNTDFDLSLICVVIHLSYIIVTNR